MKGTVRMKTRSWRQPVAAWFRGQSQVWVEGGIDRLFTWVQHQDADWVIKEQKRWERVQDLQQERKIKRLKGETRIRVIQEERLENGDIMMKVWVYQRFLYSIKEQFFEQEESNGFSIQLAEGQAGWFITKCKVEPEMNIEVERYWSYYQPPDFGTRSGSAYNRMKAVQYAETWWNGANPRYQKFEVDCTNYVSQCLHAGGVPMEYSYQRGRGWWYRGSRENWSYSWAVAHSLKNYLDKGGVHRAEIVDSPRQLQPGDIICYDWDGNGRWQHNTIVTALDASGEPLVNAHTVNSRHRYWDYRDSHGWTPKVQYRFYHIPD